MKLQLKAVGLMENFALEATVVSAVVAAKENRDRDMMASVVVATGEVAAVVMTVVLGPPYSVVGRSRWAGVKHGHSKSLRRLVGSPIMMFNSIFTNKLSYCWLVRRMPVL